MSVSDLNPPIAGIHNRTRVLRGKIPVALATCLAFTAISQVNAAANMVTESATATITIPPSSGEDASSNRASIDDRCVGFQTQTARIFTILVPSGATVPASETTGSLPPHREIAPAPQRQEIVTAGETITGIASTYNPEDPTDLDAGNEETASGERYDSDSWTAAIRTDLRGKFGGVRFGRNYQPAFALVEAGGKSFIVKINDVGPLRPGRIIDLNVRSMRYLDPTMQRGLIADVKVTPLAGQDWALGPVTDPQPVTVARRDMAESETR
jgi:rare lipoprotein A